MRKLTRSIFGTLLILVCALSLIAAGQPQKRNRKASDKAAWEWTVEERIAERTDREAARERIRERGDRLKMTIAPATSGKPEPLADAFDGKTHPELFLPNEVFNTLIQLAFLPPPRSIELTRQGLLAEVKEHGLPDDFFDRLDLLTTVHVADARAVLDALSSVAQQSGAARERAEQVLALKNRDACRSRADALAAARREFGEKKFDRFLYDVIAPPMFIFGDSMPGAAVLRQVEDGCR